MEFFFFVWPVSIWKFEGINVFYWPIKISDCDGHNVFPGGGGGGVVAV